MRTEIFKRMIIKILLSENTEKLLIDIRDTLKIEYQEMIDRGVEEKYIKEIEEEMKEIDDLLLFLEG